ncbi:MAG: peptide chain release factor N(5)-glutamine methyltransferase [Clostridia bacterium]|nr:peptide chain release factor N(5)-glutamine methyltransferase [Clostridia bacterium]
MTLGKWLLDAEQRLLESGCPDSRLETRLIAAGVLNKSPGEIRFLGEEQLNEETLSVLNERVLRRSMGEPLQYIQNTAYFMDFAFYVDENVLIPRQDTETLVELALEKIKNTPEPDVLDMCTGSGAIAVSIALYRKDADVYASDISKGALGVTERNARQTGANVSLILSDLFENIPDKKFDLITVNPPYLTGEDMRALQREVKKEPPLALFGGEDGLDFYRRIAKDVRRYLKPRGFLIMEVGMGQAEDVTAIFDGDNTLESGIQKDLCGVDRVVWIRSLDH